jgi:putative transposase
MTRPIRIEYAGALYHVTARGDRQEAIFLSDQDRIDCLCIVEKTGEQFNWLVHAYCLMDGYYHLLIETPDSNLSKGIRQLNGVFTQTSNRTHGKVGHVFQGRYKAILVQRETYLLELARYIVLNPVRARIVRQAKGCPWRSYLATAGFREPPGRLTVDWLLAAFSRQKAKAMEKYQDFIADGKTSPVPGNHYAIKYF